MMLTVKQLAEYLNVSRGCVYKMICRKQIPYYKPNGKRVYFKLSDVEQWVTSIRVNSQAEAEAQATEYNVKKQML